MGKLVKGFWDCNFCKTTAIGGDLRNCPNCGKARDENTKFYINPKKIIYVSDEEAKKINRNPDWVCKYCNQLNSDNDTHCISCGSERNEENLDYFENLADKSNSSSDNSTEDSKENRNNSISFNEEYYQNRQVFPDKSCYRNKNDNNLSAFTTSHSSFNKRKGNSLKDFFIFNRSKFLIALVILIVIAGLVYFFTPKLKEYTIQGLCWKNSIDIERYQTVDESDWTLPATARLKYTRNEFSHYEDVLDHYETKTRLVTKQRIAGYEERVTGHRDLGNGYFEEITSSYPVYESYQEIETYSEPVYRQEAVYRTKYYYEIDKWLYERSVRTNGNDKNPYFDNPNLKSDERESGRFEEYYIIGLNEKGENERISMSKEDWDLIEIGQKVKLKVLFGHGELEKILPKQIEASAK